MNKIINKLFNTNPHNVRFAQVYSRKAIIDEGKDFLVIDQANEHVGSGVMASGSCRGFAGSIYPSKLAWPLGWSSPAKEFNKKIENGEFELVGTFPSTSEGLNYAYKAAREWAKNN